MTDGRLHRFFSRFADIRPDETRAALYLFIYFFLVTFSIYVVKPVKENFLIGVTPAWWPYADLLTAALIGFVIAINARLLNKLPRRTYASATAFFFLINVLVFWFVFSVNRRSMFISPTQDASGLLGLISFQVLIRNSWPLPVFVFSLWVDIFIVMSVTQFWIAVNDLFDPHQAKRTIGFFVTGGLAGGIAGSLATSRLAQAIGPANLLLICPFILLLSVGIIHLVYEEQTKLQGVGETGVYARAGTRVGYLESLRAVGSSRYLRLLAGVLASAMVVGTLINYQFKIAIKDAIPNAAVRTSFLGTFFLAILVLSLAFHLAATGRILRRFGIRLALLLAPAALLLGGLSVFLLPAAAGLMVWACLVRGGDKALDTTTSQSVRELLYIPIPAEIKYKAKIFIDMFVNKFATGLAAALFWILYRVSSFAYKTPSVQVREVALVMIAFALTWGVLIWVIYAEYLGIVKKDLTRRWQDGNQIVADNVDVEAARLVFDTLQSRGKSSALYAMNLFELVQKEKLTPELMSVIALKEDEITARSMDALLDVGGEIFYPGIEETLADEDFEVQIKEVLALDTFKTVMKKHLGDVVGSKSESEVERMEAAKLMGMMEASPDVSRFLGRLLQDESPDVLNYALMSAAVHRLKEHVPLMIRLLGNLMTQQTAQDALKAFGPGIEETLKKHLQSPSESLAVRQAIPEILARIGDQKAVDILTSELVRNKEDLERELVDALYRIRSAHPEARFRERRVRAAVFTLIRKSCAAILDASSRRQRIGVRP